MERRAFRISGFIALAVLIIGIFVTNRLLGWASGTGRQVLIAWIVTIAAILAVLLVSGWTVVNPNEARVVQFFGRYIGTIDRPGFHWTVPLTTKRRLSLRVGNFETPRLKVSDADGNPVEIAAVIVWRVVDPYRAAFAVNDHVAYVAVQAETAVRHLATTYPYEAHETGRPSLRDATVVSEELTNELRTRVETAGVEIVESRVTHLAYAPEIAQAMLARQQASAIVAARFRIV